MFTQNTNYDYYYNRQFQRFRYLTEDAQGEDKEVLTSRELLADLGVQIEQRGHNHDIRKKSPHFKYL